MCRAENGFRLKTPYKCKHFKDAEASQVIFKKKIIEKSKAKANLCC